MTDSSKKRADAAQATENDADFDMESTYDNSEFAKLFEASMKTGGKAGGKKRPSVGDRIRGEILVLGREEVFVSTGSQSEGHLHRRELTEREAEPGQAPFKVGDVIDCFVVAVKGTDVTLSLKPTARNLSEDLEDAHDKMLPVSGRVVEVVKGGFRVQVMGKLAFCPISQMDTRRIEGGEEYIGQRYDFLITQITEGGRNVVVSRRKLLDEQKEILQGSFLSEHRAGDVVPGTVKRLEKFGAFVELAPGIEGLLHISEMSWSRLKDPSEAVGVGQQLSVKILKIESMEGKHRISLSLKDAGNDPWNFVHEKTPVGTVVKGRVERVEHYGVFVKVSDGIVGLLPRSKAADAPEVKLDQVKVGDELTVRVDEIKVGERRVSLGLPRENGEDDWRSYSTQSASSQGASGGFATLGDKLRAAMEKKGSGKK